MLIKIKRKFDYFSLSNLIDKSESVREIAPEPISKINPIVSTIKKINATVKPKVLTWYKVTAIGNNNKITRSNNKNNKANIKKEILNWLLFWPKKECSLQDTPSFPKYKSTLTFLENPKKTKYGN